MVNAWREGRIVLTAVELDLFSAVGDGATATEVARRLNTDLRGTDCLLHALAALGLLEKRAGAFHNGPVAARFLCAGAPDDRRGALLHGAALWHRWSALTECVRTGRPAPRGPRDEADTAVFIAAMHANSTQRAPALIAALELSGVRRVLDLGGGSGGHAIALARAVPGARIEVLDLADVVPLTARYVAAAGLADRVRTRVGDLNADDLGAGYDLVLISAICHMNGPAAERGPDPPRGALARTRRPRRGARPHPRAGPHRARGGAIFAVNMLVNTPAGGNYTEAEYFGWMRDAGLADVAHVRMPGPAGLIVGTREVAALWNGPCGARRAGYRRYSISFSVSLIFFAFPARTMASVCVLPSAPSSRMRRDPFEAELQDRLAVERRHHVVRPQPRLLRRRAREHGRHLHRVRVTHQLDPGARHRIAARVELAGLEPHLPPLVVERHLEALEDAGCRCCRRSPRS